MYLTLDVAPFSFEHRCICTRVCVTVRLLYAFTKMVSEMSASSSSQTVWCRGCLIRTALVCIMERNTLKVSAFHSSLCLDDRCSCCCFPYSCTHLKQKRQEKKENTLSINFILQSFFLPFLLSTIISIHRINVFVRFFFCLIIQRTGKQYWICCFLCVVLCC